MLLYSLYKTPSNAKPHTKINTLTEEVEEHNYICSGVKYLRNMRTFY